MRPLSTDERAALNKANQLFVQVVGELVPWTAELAAYIIQEHPDLAAQYHVAMPDLAATEPTRSCRSWMSSLCLLIWHRWTRDNTTGSTPAWPISSSNCSATS